jgi:methyl-accepting chemotaxis protein
LAEQSRATVEQLHDTLLDAQRALEHATEVVEAGSQQIEHSALSARQLEAIFGKLAESLDETESAAQRIVVVVDRQSGGLETLAETLNDSNRFAEQARVSLQLVDTATRDLERLVRERQPAPVA